MAAPFHIGGLDHIVIRVRDMARMTAFYRDMLGCPIEKVQDKLGLWQLRAGRTLIDLVDVKGEIGCMGGAPPGREARNMDHFCLRVDPFDGPAILAYLRQCGVEPGEIKSRYGADGDGPSIYLDDPEGNTVELKGPPTSPPAAPR
jgi:catechol 2,3-dioxygenase-like lactoylglutathione lyase family enzyme